MGKRKRSQDTQEELTGERIQLSTQVLAPQVVVQLRVECFQALVEELQRRWSKSASVLVNGHTRSSRTSTDRETIMNPFESRANVERAALLDEAREAVERLNLGWERVQERSGKDVHSWVVQSRYA